MFNDDLYVLKKKETNEVVAWGYSKKEIKCFIEDRKLKKKKYGVKKINTGKNKYINFEVDYEEYQLLEIKNNQITVYEDIILEETKYNKLYSLHYIVRDLKSMLKDFNFSKKETKLIKKIIKILDKYLDLENDKKINKFIKYEKMVKQLVNGKLFKIKR